MKSLSQSEYGELRSLYESIYTPVELTEEIIDEVFDELFDELLEEGYEEEEALSLLEDATDAYLEEAKVTFGHDTTARRASGSPVGARRRYGMRKAGEALSGAKKAAGGAYKTAKAKAAGAAVDASLAYDSAKKKAGEAAKAVKDAPGKVRAAGSDAKKKAKKGIKGLIGRAAKKVASKAAAVASRMSEEVEALKASGKFSEKEIEAIMEADMIDENRAAARAAGGYKDDSKKQTDPSKPGFTGISGSIKDIMRQNKEIEARNKKK
tara:strand:+ start:17 stop:814 length:798 start_codon:yes stop_codon:yes gene_type:complete